MSLGEPARPDASATASPAIPPAAGVRMPWERLPVSVRRAVGDALGSPVVSAVTQPGGFSPGVAARVTTASGERAFVKAVSDAPNPDSPRLHRREARVAGALPADAPVPRLRHVHDDGTWVALVFDDADGRQPELPWRADELAAVLAAIGRLHTALTPAPLPDVAPVAKRYGKMLSGWRWLVADSAWAALADTWSRRNLDRLATVEARWADDAGGETLLHADIRADNLLITGAGQVLFVDWPHACVGAPWFDVVLMAPSVAAQGGPPPGELLARCPSSAGVPNETILATVVALAGYFTAVALRPPPPGLPTIRAFQAAQGAVAREWARELTGW